MSAKLIVDRDLCEANAVCVRTAPELFRVDDADKLHLLAPHPSDDLIDKARAAVRRCPRQALSLVDE